MLFCGKVGLLWLDLFGIFEGVCAENPVGFLGFSGFFGLKWVKWVYSLFRICQF